MSIRISHLAFALSLAVPGVAAAQTTTTTPMTHTPAMTAPGTGMTAPGTTGTGMTGTGMTGHTGMSSGMSSSTGMASSAGGLTHYASQSEAASSCPGDTVVWASPRSKALHTSDSRYFGKSKHGFYACEKTAMAGGYHLAGTGKKHKAS